MHSNYSYNNMIDYDSDENDYNETDEYHEDDEY
jgi:hypothetical protein